MHTLAAFFLLSLSARLATVSADKPLQQTLVPLNDTECAGKAAGKWPPWNLPLPPHPPLCQGAYVECDGASPSGELVEDGLGSLPAPGGSSVPAVFSWVTRGGVLPGAIGTRGCDCEAAYGRDAEGAVACRVCEALQDASLCDARRAANDSTYACLAPFPDQEQRHIECTVQGPSVVQGPLPGPVDPAVQDVVDIALGIKEPTKRFAVFVQQDLADPMLDTLATAGLDQDQFMRLVRDPGQAWTFYDIWPTEGAPDGRWPTDAELEALNGFIISGDSGRPSDSAEDRLHEIIRQAAAAGKRVMGTCGGNGEITHALGGVYESLMSGDPYSDRLEFGATNISVNAAARAAVNASWADILPDSFILNEMHDYHVRALPPGAVQLGYSKYETIDTYVAGPEWNILAFQGHPEATDGAAGRSVAEHFMYHAAEGMQQAVDGGKYPAYVATWMAGQVGRMEAAYRAHSDAEMLESYGMLQRLCRAFLNA